MCTRDTITNSRRYLPLASVQSSSYGSPPVDPPPGTPHGDLGAHNQKFVRQKSRKAAEICDACRQLKSKCDEGRPSCSHCKESGRSCTYGGVPPSMSKKHANAIQDKLDDFTRYVKSMAEQNKSYEAKIDRLAGIHEDHQHRLEVLEATSPVLSLSNTKPVVSSEDDPADDGTASATSQTARSMAALLAWPVIKSLIPSDYKSSYVMDSESARGVLRLHGTGEGEEMTTGYDATSSPTTGPLSDHSANETLSASPCAIWGTASYASSAPNFMHGAHDHPGGLAPYGGLLFDAEVVDKLLMSYLDRMHKLHPFLAKQSLYNMVTAFKQEYSRDFKPLQAKRKWEGCESPSSKPNEYLRPQATHALVLIEHSVTNAIILLVLALGKVCAFRDPLPGTPSPANAVWTSTPHNVHLDAPMPFSTSTLGASNSASKNMDIIPGLAYFSKAALILGEMPGGIDVDHVQANLLAGLYMDQLGRIFPSHWYIHNACTAIQIVINSSPYKEKKMSAAQRDLINFCFWSCLQLESDLLEMDLPPSGILAKEGEMLYENPVHLTLYDGEGMDSIIEEHRHYIYQIELCKMLNDGLRLLYRTNRDGELPPKRAFGAIVASLQKFRRNLADWDWDDNDHQSPDTNVARLRGKYYGVQHVLTRPLLYYALTYLTTLTSHRPSASPAAVSGSLALSNHPDRRRGVDSRPPSFMVYKPIEEWILDTSKTCIHATIRSTTCFDKVPSRLVITNIVGTAHAQFGNVLILSATYCSQHPQLRALVEENQLRFLLDRTIKFLQKHEAISPALGKDVIILQQIRSHIFNLSIH